MKSINLDHWFVSGNNLSISLLNLHANIKVLKNDKFIYYQLVVTDRNMETIKAMTKQYNISLDMAEKIYRDVRFFTHGMATQLAVNSIKLTEEEIKELIKQNIEINLRGK